MIKHIDVKKWEEFIQDFKNNPKKWYKDQIKNDWEFNEETQLEIIEECINEFLVIKYIKNPTEEMCLEAIRQNLLSIIYIPKIVQTQKIVDEFFKYPFISIDEDDLDDSIKCINTKFITPEYAAKILAFSDCDDYIPVDIKNKALKEYFNGCEDIKIDIV